MRCSLRCRKPIYIHLRHTFPTLRAFLIAHVLYKPPAAGFYMAPNI